MKPSCRPLLAVHKAESPGLSPMAPAFAMKSNGAKGPNTDADDTIATPFGGVEVAKWG